MSSSNGAAAAATVDLCVVCGARSNTYSFGVFCCRACCAFFRRSLTKKYTCRREGNCKIDQDGMRNACRACRLARCYKAGMAVDSEKTAGTASTKSDQPSSASSSVPTSLHNNASDTAQQQLIDFSFSQAMTSMNVYAPVGPMVVAGPANSQEPDPAQFPFIHKVLNDFLTLQRSQKSLYSIENPHTIFTDTEFQQINKTLFKRMENGTMSLIHNLLSETLDYYGHLDTKTKIEVAKQVAQKYASLHRCFLTAKHFPDPSDKRIATHYGYYIDPTNVSSFFDNPTSPYTPDQKAKLLAPVLEISWKICNKFRTLKIRELEVAAMASVFIWNKLEDMDLMTPEMALRRDATHREFHLNLVAKYGIEVGPTRLVRILSLIEDILNLNSSYAEMVLVASIFTPDGGDCGAANDCVMTSQYLTTPQ